MRGYEQNRPRYFGIPYIKQGRVPTLDPPIKNGYPVHITTWRNGEIPRSLCAISEPLAPPQVVLADYFPTSLHNDPQKIISNIVLVRHRWTASQPKSCRQRPKRHVTPYPGRFCRELLCFEDFTRNPSCNLKKTRILRQK